MPEIFRFTQLREPTGINIEVVRQQHIQFFNKIEDVQEMSINKAFLKGFKNGIDAIDKYIVNNEGFLIRTKIPRGIILEEYKKFDKTYFELGYLLSQFNSDKKENDNEELFSQILKKVEEIDKKQHKELLTLLNVYFEDLLVLYFKSNAYPSYLRFLIGLRKWHFVFNNFTLTEIKGAFKVVPKNEEKIEENTVLHFLFKAKILLPKYLFEKLKEKKPKDPTDNDNPKGDPKPIPNPILKKKTKQKKTNPKVIKNK